MRGDRGIDTLIDLHKQIIEQNGSYWIKIEAWKVQGNRRGSLWNSLLFNTAWKLRKRMLGYDNAHAIKPPKKFNYAGRKLNYDHKHRSARDKSVPYEFQDAVQLLTDFFAKVGQVLRRIE